MGLGQAKNSPVEPFGLSLTMFVIAAGGVLLWSFVTWQRHRETSGTDPPVHLTWSSCRRCGRGWWACSPRT